MDLNMTNFHGCSILNFVINGVYAELDHFGEGKDEALWDAPDYGCGNYIFKCYDKPLPEVLNHYNISIEEYHEICSMLEQKLSCGYCEMCS